LKLSTGKVPGTRPRASGIGLFSIWLGLLTAVCTLFASTASAAIAYVQGIGNYAGTSGTLAATFQSTQSAGNLIVVAVAWANATTTVTSVTDSKGNAYSLAVGPVRRPGQATAYIYYARNIAAAAARTNTVTVRLSSQNIVWPDIRIAEYSGADKTNPLDVVAAAAGTGTTASTPNFTTTNANDMIVGHAFVQNAVTGAGSGFTSRVPDNGNILEDRVTTSAGVYSASAPVSPSGWWIMSAAAFRAAATASDTQAPTVPAGLVGAAVSSSQINLSWTASTDNVGVTGYSVERCQGASCTTFSQVATPSGTSFSNTALTGGTTYRYRVRARDAAGNFSGYSAIASAATPAAADTQPPTVPANLAAAPASSSTINLSWAASTDNVAVTGYRVERCQGAGCSTFSQIATTTTTNYSDAALAAATSYTYRVRAQDAAANLSGYSSTQSATTQAPGDSQVPSTPSELSLFATSSREIDLTWGPSTDNVGVTGYVVERCQGAGCNPSASVTTVATTLFNDTGRSPSTSYTYQVRARDAANNLSAPSNRVTSLTPPSSPDCD